ncbi:hypothetical protein [Emergencia sp.]|uniref:hypothetical protein n=1 Tax=Emergencia sp. TaxID=1926557 RepID=UPI003AF1A6E1
MKTENSTDVLELLTNINDNLNVLNCMFYIFIVVGGVYLFWKMVYKLLMRFG